MVGLKRSLLLPAALSVALVLCYVAGVLAVQKHKFRTCAQTGFCRRNRGGQFVPQNYRVQGSSVAAVDATCTLTADLLNTRHPKQRPLKLSVSILENGVVRVSAREHKGLYLRWEVNGVLQEESLKPLSTTGAVRWSVGTGAEDEARVTYTIPASGKEASVRVRYFPFAVEMVVDGKVSALVNPRGKMVFEQFREKNPKPAAPAAVEESASTDDAAAAATATAATADASDTAQNAALLSDQQLEFPYDVDGMWEESFDGHTDSRPRGPAAVGLDVSFPGAAHIYGLPEHATSFSLKDTDSSPGAYSEPFRLFNLDVFEYELDVPMALYGSVPMLVAHGQDRPTVGVYWNNAAETFVDVSSTMNTGDISKTKETQWISETGIIDLFIMPGPAPKDVFFQYNSLVGMPALPQRFAVSYHQCRWNYKSEEDVAQVDAGFDENDIPYDVLWLDIEHTDGKKYFTWDSNNFPTPRQMQRKLAAKERKMVTIVDPHIKRENGYKVHTRATSQDLYVKKADESTYEGWCWPGSVSYLDFTMQRVREFWASLFSVSEYEGSTKSLYTWNDMNEPSVFNGPEVTMPKDCLHSDAAVEHREVHNIYGHFVHQATSMGHLLRSQNTDRPFVLTRAFFAGTQRFSAVWTGDNTATWPHLESTVPMLLSLNVAGITFSGADVGGFFGHPEPELLVRWYQQAAFQPFFRAHAHFDSPRREPWLFGQQNTDLIRAAVRQRYRFLPYIYSTFREASVTGTPIMRPLWVEFPSDKSTFAVDNAFMLGAAILVTPVMKQQQRFTNVAFPGDSDQLWYGLWDDSVAHQGGTRASVRTPLDVMPVAVRGGHIVPQRWRARRNSAMMQSDPFTLTIAVASDGTARGALYLDDGHSFEYQNSGAFAVREFTLNAGVLSNRRLPEGVWFKSGARVERVVLYDQTARYTTATVTLQDGTTIASLPIVTSGLKQTVALRGSPTPAVSIDSDWTISFS